MVQQVYDHQSNMTPGNLPLLVIDGWEHAFYLQFEANKQAWVDVVLADGQLADDRRPVRQGPLGAASRHRARAAVVAIDGRPVHVLLATDGSDIALAAAKRGLAVLGDPTKITLLSVFGDLAMDSAPAGSKDRVYTPEQEEELRKSEERNAARALADTEKVVRAARPDVDDRADGRDAATRPRPSASSPSDLGVDVVVVGSHGRVSCRGCCSAR